MKTALLIHGWSNKEEYFDPKRPSDSNNHWFPWLQHELLLRGILAQTPEMPDAYEPQYEKWKWMFEQFSVDEETVLVGHSCGGGFLVRWLSENNVKVGKVVLVAPWLDPNHMIDPRFFDFEIDENMVRKTKGVTIMYSTDDFPDVARSVSLLKEKLKAVEFQEFSGKGHFCLRDLQTEEFPELLQNILK